MMHEYYSYTAKELMAAPKIPLQILKDNNEVFRTMADEMITVIQEKAMKKEQCVMICPVGPVGQYPYFVERVNREGISLKHCWFINMDEYLDDNREWVSIDHPLSFRGFMKRNVYDRIRPELNVPEEQRVFPDPHDIQRIPNLICQLGGVDAAFGGIGINGHLAFNEPQSELTAEEFALLQTRVLEISRETRTANAIGDFGGALEDMPKYCVTIGFREISEAKMIRLGVFRNWHSAVVRRAAYGEVTSEFPVSILQGRDDVLIRMTEYVAGVESC